MGDTRVAVHRGVPGTEWTSAAFCPADNPGGWTDSSLVCRVTGRIMDADNPPLMLPNGYVYSTEVFIVVLVVYEW